MIGWLITDKKVRDNDYDYKIHYGKYTFLYKSNGQFLNDKIFYENDKYIVCLDGIILNKNKFLQNNDWANTIITMFESEKSFPNMLRGSFNGFVYDKVRNSLDVYTDHLGERAVFYSQDEKFLAVSSNYNMLLEMYVENGIERRLCPNAVKYMLTFGYMIDDSTYIDSIKRLMPGMRLSWTLCNNISIKKENYHVFTNKNVIEDETENIISKIDELFRNALQMALEKDKEYGKKSLIDLSGGLDCRVINYVAKAMGYTNVINVSFSQLNSNEYKVTMKLNKDLKNDMIFFPLDNANYISKLEKIVSLNYGLSLYSTTTGVLSIIDNLNFNSLGIEHGGLLGEMHDGAMPGANYYKQEPASFEKGMRFSRVISNDILDKSILSDYENNEIFTLIGRGLLAGYSTVMIRHNVCEFLSPFADVDFYDYFLSIPLEKRVKGKILQKWIEKYYPEAFEIEYDKTMCRINGNKMYIGTKVFCGKVLYKIKQYLGITVKNNMNPFDYWYKTNHVFKNFINEYYEQNISAVKCYPDLQELISKLYKKGTVRDKTMSLTALAAVKLYITD